MGETSSSRRRFGVLLPVPSLPGRGPVGDLGPGARQWLGWLREAGATLWQVLPIGPLGYGNSPYSSLSSFAVSPLLLSVEDLTSAGWISDDEAGEGRAPRRAGRIDYHAAEGRIGLHLRQAYARLDRRPGEWEAFEAFRDDPETSSWLEDWTLYAALKAECEGRSWLDWPESLRRRDPDAMSAARARLSEELELHAFTQYLLARQLDALHAEARRHGIALVGDLPYYPALDSADVWSRPDLFDLDSHGRPRQVAGVPPDAFAATGQLWGNPVYRWERHAAEGYRWWIERVRASLRFVDYLRLDHFRGFSEYWAVPAGEATAVGGEWVEGPGESLFSALRQQLGGLPLVAEDLGHITTSVRALRRRLAVPGMRVLQFAFDKDDSEHLPERATEDTVIYTGTHDNDTTRGWFSRLRGAERRRARAALAPVDGDTVHLAMLRATLDTDARWAVAPVQDLLGSGSDARLNTPGRPSGQWTWRLSAIPDADLATTLRRLAVDSGRWKEPT